MVAVAAPWGEGEVSTTFKLTGSFWSWSSPHVVGGHRGGEVRGVEELRASGQMRWNAASPHMVSLEGELEPRDQIYICKCYTR